MELSLTRQTIEVEKRIGENELQTQVTAETATPGAGREAIEVLMEEAEVSVDSIDAQTDRIVVDGTVVCQAVYRQGDASAARAVTAQGKFSEVVELDGVTSRSIIQVNAAVEAVDARYDNGRMIFTPIIALRAQAHALEPVEVISQITGISGLETRFQEVCSSKLAAESSADAILREEVALPGQLDARVALMDWAQARLTSLTPDLGGVRAQGEVQAEALIGTGVSARPIALVKVVMPFDQLVELPEWLANGANADATVTRLISEVVPGDDEGDVALKLEAQINICVRAEAQDCATALADAYATGDRAVTCELGTMTLATGTIRIEQNESFRGTLMLPDGAPGVGTVLATRVRPVISQWHVEGGQTILEGALDVKALYLPTGSEQVTAARGELPFTIRGQQPWPESAWMRVSASAAEATALMNDRLEIRCALVLNGTYRQVEDVTLAVNVTEGEAAARPGGLVIHWPNPGDSTWDVAKRYVLPVGKVIALNSDRETLAEGQPIVLRI